MRLLNASSVSDVSRCYVGQYAALYSRRSWNNDNPNQGRGNCDNTAVAECTMKPLRAPNTCHNVWARSMSLPRSRRQDRHTAITTHCTWGPCMRRQFHLAHVDAVCYTFVPHVSAACRKPGGASNNRHICRTLPVVTAMAVQHVVIDD